MLSFDCFLRIIDESMLPPIGCSHFKLGRTIMLITKYLWMIDYWRQQSYQSADHLLQLASGELGRSCFHRCLLTGRGAPHRPHHTGTRVAPSLLYRTHHTGGSIQRPRVPTGQTPPFNEIHTGATGSHCTDSTIQRDPYRDHGFPLYRSRHAGAQIIVWSE